MKTKLFVFYFLLTGCLQAESRPRKVLRNLIPQRALQIPPSMSQDLEVTELVGIRPHNFEALEEGRFFKHILLLKGLMQPPSNHTDFMLPYLIINNPTNLTNINNNALNNVPATAAPITTGTGTGAGAGTGGAAPAPAGARITFIPGNQALPYGLPIPLNTPVYQQRQQDHLPQMVYGIPLMQANKKQRKRNRFRISNKGFARKPKPKNTNPFANLANNWSKVQFL